MRVNFILGYAIKLLLLTPPPLQEPKSISHPIRVKHRFPRLPFCYMLCLNPGVFFFARGPYPATKWLGSAFFSMPPLIIAFAYPLWAIDRGAGAPNPGPLAAFFLCKAWSEAELFFAPKGGKKGRGPKKKKLFFGAPKKKLFLMQSMGGA